MAQFWLATFETGAPPAPTASPSAPLAASGSSRFAVEFIQQGTDRAVLFSTVDDIDEPRCLTCLVGFVNTAAAANLWRDRGYPIVDAAIAFDPASYRLSVRCACFHERNEMDYETDILAVTGVQLAPMGTGASFPAPYVQAEESPDFAAPATTLIRRSVTWTPYRHGIRVARKGTVELRLKGVRSPSFVPLVEGVLDLNRIWSGETRLEEWTSEFAPPPFVRAPRADTFGIPAFRFDDVEVIGFRIDLADLGADWPSALDALVAPLNFHLQEDDDGSPGRGFPPADFRYRAATSTLVVELLRYGRMRLREAAAPLTADDYQSQHELVVRVLVGRVDDDTSQARDAAVFVPAIFVDNPWSKALGRDVQGFDKRMAAFCVAGPDAPVALRPNGCLPGRAVPSPLLDVAEVRLLDEMGTMNGTSLVEFDYPLRDASQDDEFTEIDIDIALASSSLVPGRWRQHDFGDVGFRRGFARTVAAQALRGFRSIQVAPVADRQIGKTWIQGTFSFDERVLYARPGGVAAVTFHAAPTAPPAWLAFCSGMGIAAGQSCSCGFPTGSWYRMKVSMDLTIENPLD